MTGRRRWSATAKAEPEPVVERAAPSRGMRFLVDQCLSVELAEPVTDAGHDVTRLRNLGMQRAQGPEVTGQPTPSGAVEGTAARRSHGRLGPG